MNKRLLFGIFVLAVVGGTALSTIGQAKHSSKVLLIPLDDRPPCLQFTVKMGLIGDADVVTPPREMLGRFTVAGRPDEIIAWIRKQNLKTYDAAIVSMDMIAYGGLVASRVHDSSLDQALKRIVIVREIRRLSPKLKIYGSSVIMRLAPTADGKNEAYREKLAKWAEVSPDKNEEKLTKSLESEIPAEALQNYKTARDRNLKINLGSVDLVRDGIFDYLILSQDDAKPRGVHVRDRETLIDYVNRNSLSEKVAIQPGADEVSMLLLARSLTTKYNYHPKIKAIYSSDEIADKFMPYEDRPLRKTVSFHIRAVGATEVSDESQAELLFYVFVSRFEKDRAKAFADDIADKVKANKRVLVADIDVKGEIQGGDESFTESLLGEKVFNRLYSYAAWNTAGNTIGTTLPQGVVFQTIINRNSGSKDQKNRPDASLRRTRKAQDWFMVNRLLDDYAYHSLVRPRALQFIRESKWNAFRLDDDQTRKVTGFCVDLLNPVALEISQKYFETTTCSPAVNFALPWNRTFEAEIDFTDPCPGYVPGSKK